MIQNTKEVFADSLKKMLENKRLEHITVKDIVEDCGVSRQAFYYHFDDIYDLVEWIFIDERKKVFANNINIDTWQQGYLNILEWICSNKKIVVNVYRSVSREYLELFLYNVVHGFMYPIIKKKAEEMNIENKSIEFVSHFYSLALVALDLDWIRTGMKETPNEIVKQLTMLKKVSFQEHDSHN